ncbi:MAG: glycoside hydrolase family 2 TIM barrel-domain containing protein [Clostridia bacterium]
MDKIILNNNWLFKEKSATNFETVTLPHTVKLEELNVFANYKSVFEYSYELIFDDSDRDKNIFINFDGVMINCEVLFNEQTVCKHFGGYLPFIIDITQKIKFNASNKITVIVDNHDDATTPPGKATDGLDFLYYGGIYRPVTLIKTAKIYITNPLEEGGGGIKFYCKKNGAHYNANITAFVKNTLATEQNCAVAFEIKDCENNIIAQDKKNCLVAHKVLQVDCHIDNILVNEWSLDYPNLYILTVKIMQNDKIIEQATEQIGFRTAEVKDDGFYLNGKKIELFGTNRHQQYPYIGIAASPNAERREARLLKQSGINTLRLAHYPQSPAFLAECDRLGMIVIDCVPGWQFWGGKLWQERLQQNLIDMIRRDRNHPACIIYEITPNETNCLTAKGDNYFKNFIKIAKRELPTIIVSGDTLGRKSPATINFDIPHTGNNKTNFLSKLLKKQHAKLPLQREYGDWNFGGNNSTSRVSRGDGEFKMQVQAWNFGWTYNSLNLANKLIGSLTWEGIDHNRGYFPKEGLSKSGFFDVFRLKKYTYYFLKSQKKPVNPEDIVLFPLINSIANKTKIPVYSNCQMVKIFNGSNLIAQKACDNGATVFYDSKKMGKIDEAYWLTAADHIATSEKICNEAKHTISCLFDGGNCEFMKYPPFTFTNLNLNNISALTFKGYIDGKEVKTFTFTEPQKAVSLQIDFCDNGVKLLNDNNDFLFVYALAKDKNDCIDINFNKSVTIVVKDGSAIFTNTINAEAGIASFLVKANFNAKNITITASCDANLLTTEASYTL